MATVSGRIFIESGQGVTYIEVSERAVAGLLRDDNFEVEKGEGGQIGYYRGIPVTLKPVVKRK
jgi:hypothetical protein